MQWVVKLKISLDPCCENETENVRKNRLLFFDEDDDDDDDDNVDDISAHI